MNPTMILFAVTCMLATACCEDAPPTTGAPLVPGAWSLPATIYATADNPAQADLWREQVRLTVEYLNFGIRAVSYLCDAPVDPFVVGEAGDHEVRLVEDSSQLEPGVLGAQDGSSNGIIVIMGTAAPWQRSPLRGAIVHQLGHALGVGHASLAYGDSAMTAPPGQQMFARDAAHFACVLGCGPCGPSSPFESVDPYDL